MRRFWIEIPPSLAHHTRLWKRMQVWFGIPVKILTECEILMPSQSNKARKKKICWGTYYKKFQNHFPHCKILRCIQCHLMLQKHILGWFNVYYKLKVMVSLSITCSWAMRSPSKRFYSISSTRATRMNSFVRPTRRGSSSSLRPMRKYMLLLQPLNWIFTLTHYLST